MFSPRPLTLPHFQTVGPSSTPSSSTTTTPSTTWSSPIPTHYAPHGYSGDGWRQMLLPIPPNVDPFRFLEELRAEWEEETRRLHRWKVSREDGSSIPRELEGSCEVLMGLPRDVWCRVAEALVREGEAGSLARVSRSFHFLLLPLLLRSPTLSSSSSLSSLTQHLTAQPSHVSLISSLSLSLTSNLDWARAEELARTLQDGGGKVKKLALRCAGSDTGKASALFACFRPETFEWTTSPCWLIRPARAFADLLRPWCEAEPLSAEGTASGKGTMLRTLRLSGFFLDDHLLEALLGLGSLERLSLTSKAVPANVLRGLLGDADVAGKTLVKGEQQEQQSRLPARRLHLNEVQLLDLPRGSASQLLKQVDDLVSPCADDVARWQSVTRQRKSGEDVILRRRM